MKKILILIVLCFCINSAVFADDNLQIPDSATKQQLMAIWLKSHPDKARELKEILSNSQNQTEALEQWLDENPDCADQLQNLVMPEGN
jgi:hypothetical protein